MKETKEIHDLERQILDLKRQLALKRRAIPRRVITNHQFDGPEGRVTLRELFGDRKDLIAIHNMGRACSDCTLWADGFNGLAPELQSRAPFVLISADPIEDLVPFSQERGWRFPCVGDTVGSFRKELGFEAPDGSPLPGAIGFQLDGGDAIRLVASTELGEGDDFCSAWHLFDLLADGWNGWRPNYRL